MCDLNEIEMGFPWKSHMHGIAAVDTGHLRSPCRKSLGLVGNRGVTSSHPMRLEGTCLSDAPAVESRGDGIEKGPLEKKKFSNSIEELLENGRVPG